MIMNIGNKIPMAFNVSTYIYISIHPILIYDLILVNDFVSTIKRALFFTVNTVNGYSSVP